MDLLHQNTLKTLKSDNIYLSQLFSTIPNNRFEFKNCDTACNPVNYLLKNRYSDILAQDTTRVKIQYSHPNFSVSDYINANYIQFDGLDVQYIATQAPLETSTFDFYQMLWEQNSNVIVTLSSAIDQFKAKAYPYWNYGESQERELTIYTLDENGVQLSANSDFFVTLLKVESDGKIITREIKLRKNAEERVVTQIHYSGWPDFGVPELEDFQLIFASLQRLYISGPVVCHCSAGVGRTGVFIAVDAILKLLKKKKNTLFHADEKSDLVYETVCKMRKQRIGMVQTPNQFLAIYLAVEKNLEYI
ncbi:hypothetical protein HK099_007865 [Clydaea vesicula]|uniref:Protein tyrosine phosphatase n=1 Tax=Clydaea vesicula TaxID=447962 RepID=A0AAD5U8V3_9FUNG|nr:hypothetical protein HK099_007865 [Clydaea vesicula]KAJ3390672.1 hypothetical protein HDU92_000340 [Lobulomyces angularis]